MLSKQRMRKLRATWKHSEYKWIFVCVILCWSIHEHEHCSITEFALDLVLLHLALAPFFSSSFFFVVNVNLLCNLHTVTIKICIVVKIRKLKEEKIIIKPTTAFTWTFKHIPCVTWNDCNLSRTRQNALYTHAFIENFQFILIGFSVKFVLKSHSNEVEIGFQRVFFFLFLLVFNLPLTHSVAQTYAHNCIWFWIICLHFTTFYDKISAFFWKRKKVAFNILR